MLSLLRRAPRALRRELQWLRRRLHAFASRREARRELKHRLKQRRRRARHRPRSSSQDLSFRSSEHWAWSMRVLEAGEVIATVQAANPLALLAMVEDYVLSYGAPRPPYSIVLRRNVNRKSVVVDEQLIGRRQASSQEHRVEALRLLDTRIDRYLEQYGGSSSMTVMIDPAGNPVRVRELLSTVCGSR